jgi:hypothetical protein
MASSPSLWYANYKGAVFPTRLCVASDEAELRVQPLRTLVECCCCKIVQDSNMTRLAAECVPRELLDTLMKVRTGLFVCVSVCLCVAT